jgi:prepilin-type N-terminal cleavage/methylation domain-containing protein/prepilin-type processing-associated H-X9-DG protein
MVDDPLERVARRRPLGGGFTLIELLVVIAIVALLVSILLPSLSGARRAARTVKCLSQMRQLGVAHTLYADANGERFVSAALAHGGLGDPRVSWPVLLAPYAEGSLVLRSPADSSPFWSVEEGGRFSGMSFARYQELYLANPQSPPTGALARWTSYGLNNYVTPNKKPPRELMARDAYDRFGKVPAPSATVHFLMMTYGADGSGFARSDHVHAEAWDDGAPGSAPTLASREMQLNAHGGGVNWTGVSNYAYVDGHAASQAFEVVYRTAEQNRFYPEVAR